MAKIVAAHLELFSAAKFIDLFTEIICLTPKRAGTLLFAISFFREVYSGKTQLKASEFNDLVNHVESKLEFNGGIIEPVAMLLHLSLRFDCHIELFTSHLAKQLRRLPLESSAWSDLATLPWSALWRSIKQSGVLQSASAFSFIVRLTKEIRQHPDCENEQQELWASLDYSKLSLAELKTARTLPHASQEAVFDSLMKKAETNAEELKKERERTSQMAADPFRHCGLVAHLKKEGVDRVYFHACANPRCLLDNCRGIPPKCRCGRTMQKELDNWEPCGFCEKPTPSYLLSDLLKSLK